MVANNDWFVPEDDWRTDATAWHCSRSHVAGCDKKKMMTNAITTPNTVSASLPTIVGRRVGTDQKAAASLATSTDMQSDAHKHRVRVLMRKSVVGSGGPPTSLAIPMRLKQGPSPELMSPGGLLSPESGAESRTDTPIQTPQAAEMDQVLGLEDTRATTMAMSTWKGGRNEPLPEEEVILIPTTTTTTTTGRLNDQVYDKSPAFSPASSSNLSVFSTNVTSPAPISQANSPFTSIQYSTVVSIAQNDNHNHDDGNSDVEVCSELGSPYSFLSTPSTAIPSPYNKLVRPSVQGARFHQHDYPTSTVRKIEEHANEPVDTMTRPDAVAAPSRWSKAPADLPQNYFGTGLAVVRPSTTAVSYDKNVSMTPPYYPSAMMSQPWESASPVATDMAYSQQQAATYEASNSVATHFELPLLPSLHPADNRASSHRVLILNEDTAVALAYWFAGRIVNRLAYPNAAIATKPQHHRRYSETHFDPYHIVPGHSYANGQIQVAYDLAFNMYQILERVQNAETILAAAYFLERLPLHDVDGHFGREFRTHLIPRRAGDVPYALERRIAAITVMLAQNTLEDRDYHLPNNMMWQIGGMEKTRFNRLKLLALQDLEWNVHINTEMWREHITKIGTDLYAMDVPGRRQPVLEHEHVEILARVFSFMYEAANQGAVDAYVPSTMANYVPLPHLPPLVEDNEASALSSPEPMYPTPPAPAVIAPPASVSVPLAIVEPSSTVVDGSYLTRKEMQEARAQRARDAYLKGKLLPTPPPAAPATPVESSSHSTGLTVAELHQRRKAAAEARARRARAAYLQRTYLQRGGRSAAMILA